MMMTQRGPMRGARGAMSGSILVALMSELLPHLEKMLNQQRTATGGSYEAPPRSSQGMELSEAEEILGVRRTDSAAAIKKAYQTLMKQYHPDAGGRQFFAAQINLAKQRLDEYQKAANRT